MGAASPDVLQLGDGLRVRVASMFKSGVIPDKIGVTRADASAGPFTITLPAASSVPGQLAVIKKIDSTGNVVSVVPAGSDTIDGATFQKLTLQYETLSIFSDGATWWVTGPIEPGDFDGILVTQPPDSSGTPPAVERLNAGAHTLVLNAEQNDIVWNLARTVTFVGGGGAIATERAALIQAPTYSSSLSQTITTAATLAISGAPSAAGGMTITNSFALWTQSGNVQFGTVDSGVTWENSHRTLSIGTRPSYAFPVSLYIQDTYGGTGNAAIYAITQGNVASPNVMSGLGLQITGTGSGSNGEIDGVDIYPTWHGTSTLQYLLGIYILAAADNGGTITGSYGIDVENPSLSNGSTITDNYGVYVGNQTAGSSHNYGVYIVGASTYALYVVGGTSRFGGQILAADGAVGAPEYSFNSVPTTGMWYQPGVTGISFSVGGTEYLRIQASTLSIVSDTAVLRFGLNADVILARDGAANILALKNGTNPQTLRVYGSGTKYLTMGHDGTNAFLASVGGGNVTISNGVHLVPSGDNGQDLGISGTNRWHNIYWGTQLIGPDGAIGTPAYSWANATSSGWYRAGAGDFRFSVASADAVRIGATDFILPATGLMEWGSSGVGGVDITLSRNAQSNAAGLFLNLTGTLNAGPADFDLFKITSALAGAFTITRNNVFFIPQPTGASTTTDMTLYRTDAAAGTHKLVDAGTTKTTPGTVNAWTKVNVNGTLHYIAMYTSKTT